MVICPDAELAERLQDVLLATNLVTIVRDLDHYPSAEDLMRYLRSQTPQVLFLSAESSLQAIEIVRVIEHEAPGLQIVAIGKNLEPQVLLDIMRAGLREFLAVPIDPNAFREAMARVSELVNRRPVVLETTEHVYAFLPSKQGVGASTVAVNTSVAISRTFREETLLMDLDLTSGIVGFMLKLGPGHSVVEAAENSHNLDESLWAQLVNSQGGLDILQAGRLNPNYRIEAEQVRGLIDFARRHYKAICVDLSGNLERYSMEVMMEAKKIFLVVTPEIPSLHLAREKLAFLSSLELGDRVAVLLNRSQKRSLITNEQIEGLLGVPVMLNLSNDYQGVHRALQAGRAVESNSELGRQFVGLANTILDRKPVKEPDSKKRLVDYLGILPGRYSLSSDRSATRT
jgi:Flp pilus assembly CpaE family ATPase